MKSGDRGDCENKENLVSLSNGELWTKKNSDGLDQIKDPLMVISSNSLDNRTAGIESFLTEADRLTGKTPAGRVLPFVRISITTAFLKDSGKLEYSFL